MLRLAAAAALTTLALALAMPAAAQPADEAPAPGAVQTPSGFDLQGHRGARGLRPENTLPAFRRALELGVTTLELDVVISADSQVVVSHEPWMSATICTKPDGTPVAEDEARSLNLFAMTARETQRYDCGQRTHPRFPEQEAVPAAKPLLRDVLVMAERFAEETGRAPVFYNVETKSRPSWDGTYHPAPDAFARRVLGVLAGEGVAARSTLQSFDVRTLQAARAQAQAGEAPPVRLALLVAAALDGGLASNLDALGFTPAVYSPEHTLVDAALVEAAHGRQMQLVPWTVNDPARMERLIELGVDGLITDYPDRATRVLAKTE
jgi:glycerophosphoryl diester phosphodiesterase